MADLNYFQLLCFFWAVLGIGSRILMRVLGARWKTWELENAYSKQKPKWLYVVGVFGLILIGYTWFAVVTMEVPYSWIIAVFVSLTAIKIYLLMFQYDQFRAFVTLMLNDEKKMMMLNIAVLLFSMACVAMAVFLN